MVTQTEFKDKNTILKSKELQAEVGYEKLPDGNYIVAMTCPMPGVTVEMIQWWFWWHPQKDERYQAWFPGEHYAISYAKKDRAYFEKAKMPEFQPNSQFPVERIAGMKMPLRIDFMDPEDFGFDKKIMEENGFPLIVCGHVGAYKGFIYHTEMAHMFRQEKDGLFLVSRFWIGQLAKGKLLRKVILSDAAAKGMAEHCYQEYRNLAAMLPELYEKRKK
jgi:hypothetical protein